MRTSQDEKIQYFLPIGENEIFMNELIGRKIEFTFAGQINCIKCGRLTNKSFHQGYCFRCFRTAPEAEDCVLRPELCRAHEGIAREMEFAKNHCLKDHYVYLALTSGLKVGVTRKTQIPTRWIDQGATSAIIIAQTPNRHLAGVIEVELKKYFADKTNWRKMLQNETIQNINLMTEKEKAFNKIKTELKKYFLKDSQIRNLVFPIERYPEKISSINFEKISNYVGILKGIKGQYLIFNDNKVLNIRKHNGFFLDINF
ncbi:MAG: DUF2797 domain-containing protein [Bacteroidales bacterium]|nr:DUF2797 domain-containing protein [Bacteroidales bacterium]